MRCVEEAAAIRESSAFFLPARMRPSPRVIGPNEMTEGAFVHLFAFFGSGAFIRIPKPAVCRSWREAAQRLFGTDDLDDAIMGMAPKESTEKDSLEGIAKVRGVQNVRNTPVLSERSQVRLFKQRFQGGGLTFESFRSRMLILEGLTLCWIGVHFGGRLVF